MRLVIPDLFVGDAEWFENGKERLKASGEWVIIHAAKDPYHRALLGYKERSAPKDSPEYLIAKRGDELYLNLVDAQDPAYIPVEIMDTALLFIEDALNNKKKVYIHCNQGESRAPGIAFLYLLSLGKLPGKFEEAEKEFKEKYYPEYNPGLGIQGFIKQNFSMYYKKQEQLDL